MYKLLIISILTTIILSSCESFDLPEMDDKITVEGWIEEDKPPIVILSKAIGVDTVKRNLSDLNEYLIKWAKVTVSDGEHSEVLTGKFNFRYYPPYIYTTGNLVGKVGKTYSLTIEYQGSVITAQTTIPPHVDIDTAYAVASSDTDDYGIRIVFNDDPTTHDYYKTFSNCDPTSNMYLSTIMQTIDDSNIDGQTIENTIYRGRLLDNDYKPGFEKGEVVMVKLCHIDRTSFEFWKDYENSLSFARNAFMRYNNNISTNISNGFGYWCGYGSSLKYVEIK